jgi:hypothetical protein
MTLTLVGKDNPRPLGGASGTAANRMGDVGQRVLNSPVGFKWNPELRTLFFFNFFFGTCLLMQQRHSKCDEKGLRIHTEF